MKFTDEFEPPEDDEQMQEMSMVCDDRKYIVLSRVKVYTS